MSWVRDNFLGGNEQKAADIQARSGREAIEFQRESRDQARDDLSTFRGIGEDVSDALLQFVLQGPETELERSRGFQDIERSAAAGGRLQSGGTLEELTGFNNMLNERNRSNRFSELFNLASLGANAASGQATATLQAGNNISSLTTGIGDSLAAGKIGKGNAIRGSVFDLARIAASVANPAGSATGGV